MSEAWKSIPLSRKLIEACTDKAILIRLPYNRGKIWVGKKLLRAVRNRYILRSTETMIFNVRDESGKAVRTCTGAELATLMGGWSDEQGSPVYFVTCEFSGEEEEIIRHVPEKIPVPEHVEIIDELLR